MLGFWLELSRFDGLRHFTGIWNYQDDKADIINTGPQVEWLRRNGYL